MVKIIDDISGEHWFWKRLVIGESYTSGRAVGIAYFDDVYIDNSWARIELCDSASWNARQKCEMQIPQTWSNNQIIITANQGTFQNGDTAYLYVIDEDGVVSTSGYQIQIGGQAPACTESWTCADWSTCIDSQQTRTCTDANSCGTTANRPALSQSCTPLCTESWSCDSWSVCTNDTQSRICTDSNSCGTIQDRPALLQSCQSEPEPCLESWTCSSWSACSNNQQSRLCTDSNSCGSIASRPSLSQACQADTESDPASQPSPPPTPDTEGENQEGGGGTPPQVNPNPPSIQPDASIELNDGSLNKAFDSSKIYFVSNNTKQYIPSSAVFEASGFIWDNIEEVAQSQLNAYQDGEELSLPNNTLVKRPDSKAVYLIKNNNRHVFLNERSFLASGFWWDDIYTIEREELIKYQLTDSVRFPDGTLVKGSDASSVYLIQNQTRRWIRNEEVFNNLNLKWHNLIQVQEVELTLFTPGVDIEQVESSLTTLINSIDTDGDGLADYQERIFGTKIDIKDTDGDGYLDGDEVRTGNDPLK